MSKGRRLNPDFWANVDVRGPDECWLWKRSKNGAGYGTVRVGSLIAFVHRHAYTLIHGAIPDGMHVCHRCDVRACCNPAHLWLGTRSDNMADMARKNRAGRAKLTTDTVAAIRRRLDLGERQADLAREFGMSPQAINYIASRKRWSRI